MVSDRDLVKRLGSVGRAFFGRFHELREVQRRSIDPILSGRNVLVSSATASGKTEAIVAPLVARLSAAGRRPAGNVSILAVAPTRALVNDLFERLRDPLADVGWSCGRQTSDHQDKGRSPNVLITTPESFDSMLVRDGRWDHGDLCGHLLASVQALFVDEAHLFDSSPRGDQLVWMIGRLRRLRTHARRKSWESNDTVQVCAASATVARPDELASKLLGNASMAILVPGTREMQTLVVQPGPGWVALDELATLDAIFGSLLSVDGPDDVQGVVQHVWRSVERGATEGCRKVLVFVPSRSLCDRLSLSLLDAFRRRREMFVGAHHGSLERSRREHAEHGFSWSRDAVLVATTTLEVGIDIGDVDVVALVGAPPDTSSLLQRIGRCGRRNGLVRVVPIVRNPIEGRALSSMLDAACRGVLDPSPRARLWSVFVQQSASFTAQGKHRGRRRSDLLALAQEVWPEADGPTTATRILDSLVEEGALVESGGRLYLGEAWSDKLERAGGGLHNNFDSGGPGIPVVDASTGEVLSHVAASAPGRRNIALAGGRWDIVSVSGEILVAQKAVGTGEATFRYATRGAPTGRSYAEHLRRGLGYEATHAPVVRGPGRDLWFHFGGSAYEAVLASLFPDLKQVRRLAGIALQGVPVESTLMAVASDREPIVHVLRRLAEDLAIPAALGRFHRLLPADVRERVALEYLDVDGFVRWLAARRTTGLSHMQDAEQRLRAALGW